MVSKKEKSIRRDKALDRLGSLGETLVDIMKAGPGPRYALTTLGLYAIGKTCAVPCGLLGSIQGINTVIAISEVQEESGILSGITGPLLSAGSGVAAGVLMNDVLADDCGCPRIVPADPAGDFKEALEDAWEGIVGAGEQVAGGQPVKPRGALPGWGEHDTPQDPISQFFHDICPWCED